LNIGCLNVRSLPLKLQEVSQFVKLRHFDIFAVNETWLDSSFTDKELEIEGFAIVRREGYK
jgi:hypothetical protein